MQQRGKNGRFFVVEGGDGAGKSTVVTTLSHSLSGEYLFIQPKRPEIADQFVKSHLEQLSAILWEGSESTPRHLLCDLHWLHLATAWYLLIDQYLVKPAVKSGMTVVSDSWTDKLLARFRLKGEDVAKEAGRCFSTVSLPDAVFMLDIDPSIAATRKSGFGLAECGNLDGLKGQTRENFVRYQTMVRESYLEIADERWHILNVTQIGLSETADWLAKNIERARAKS